MVLAGTAQVGTVVIMGFTAITRITDTDAGAAASGDLGLDSDGAWAGGHIGVPIGLIPIRPRIITLIGAAGLLQRDLVP